MDYSKIGKRFDKGNTNRWLFGGTLGIVISILLFPLTIIRAAFVAAWSKRLSYDAYEKIVDSEIADLPRIAFANFGLTHNPDIVTISTVGPCYEPLGAEPLMVRKLKKKEVQSTCVEAAEIILDGAAVRIFCRRFSTVSPVFRDTTQTLFVKDISSVRLVSEVKRLRRFKDSAVYFEDYITFATAGGEVKVAVNGDRQDSNEVFLQVDKYLADVKKPAETKQSISTDVADSLQVI